MGSEFCPASNGISADSESLTLTPHPETSEQHSLPPSQQRPAGDKETPGEGGLGRQTGDVHTTPPSRSDLRFRNGIWKPLGLGKCRVWSSEQLLEPFGWHLLMLTSERCSSTSATSFFQGLEVQ
ncbi:hypothetical protein P7K49_024661 [Saguinus oedipus]|uniref:Uncharacterized protein n=1 Tax=Saguinus oedipus TaxID=9490 RepID=A0ABQ9UR18_SAGOE|nr:hypothetical protein P7K49_024661 [Saguinus oedipus]